MSRKTLLLASGIIIPGAVLCIFISLIIKNLSPKYLYYVSENKNKLISGLIAGLVISFIVTAIAGYATYKELTKPKEAKNIEVQTKEPGLVTTEQVTTGQMKSDNAALNTTSVEGDSGYSASSDTDTDNSPSTSTPKWQLSPSSKITLNSLVEMNDSGLGSSLGGEEFWWDDDEFYNDNNQLSSSNQLAVQNLYCSNCSQQLLFEEISQIDSSETKNRVQVSADGTTTQLTLAEELREWYSGSSQFLTPGVNIYWLPESGSDCSLTNSEKGLANNNNTLKHLESEVTRLQNELQQSQEELRKSNDNELKKQSQDGLESIIGELKNKIKKLEQQNKALLEENLQKLGSDDQTLDSSKIKESKQGDSQQEPLEINEENKLKEKNLKLTQNNKDLQKELDTVTQELKNYEDNYNEADGVVSDSHKQLQKLKNEFAKKEEELIEKNQELELKLTVKNLNNQADEDTLLRLWNEGTKLKELLQARDKDLKSNLVVLKALLRLWNKITKLKELLQARDKDLKSNLVVLKEVNNDLDSCCNEVDPPLSQLIDALPTLKSSVGINFSLS